MKNYFKMFYHWWFTNEERAVIPDFLIIISVSVSISWFISSYMFNYIDLLWIDKIEAQERYEWSVIDSLRQRIDEVEYILHLHDDPWKPEPCCSIAEAELKRLDEAEVGICHVISTADSTVKLPGLAIDIGDLFNEMCPE